MHRRSLARNVLSGLGETVVNKFNWELVALIALGAVVLSNVMLFLRKRSVGG